jgi:G patch domain-containing protein 1
VTLRKLRIQEGKLDRIRLGLEESDADAGAENATMEGESGAGEAGKHTFAPRDTRLLVFQPKEEREGLGYEKGRGMGRLPKRGPGESHKSSSPQARIHLAPALGSLVAMRNWVCIG